VPPPPPPPPPAAPPTVRIGPAEPADGTWTVIEQTPATDAAWSPAGSTESADRAATTARQAVQGTTRSQPVMAVRRLQFTPLVVTAIVAAAAALVALAATLYAIDIDGTQSVAPRLGDVFSNNAGSVIAAAAALIVGAALALRGSRFGAGLAGGAGLAMMGFVAMQIGVVTQEFDSAGYDRISAGGVITVTLTRDLGFWLLVAAASAGVITFGLSLRRAGEDFRSRLDPTVSVLGAFATLAVAAGSLIPEHGVPFVRNFSDDFVPPATLYLRLGCMALIALAGAVGFLIQRRWGVGVALGGVVIAVWQWASTLGADNANASGATPLGVSGGNLGSLDGRPHPVTTVAIIATLVLALLSLWLGARSDKRHAGH
jgi:uncharacterized membrane protein